MKRIPFEAFMRTALHDPVHGYYARNIRAVGGGRGDFTTVPMHCGDVLARAIARWAAAAMRATNCRNLIEIGPGEGTLMRDVVRHLPWARRLRVRPHLVETSPVLATRQQATLGPRATWHADPAAALNTCNGAAVIFSNELVDAFPVRVFDKTANGWRELAVETDARGRVVRECLMDETPLPESSAFSLHHPPRQRVEVHDACHRWLAAWLPRWRVGEMLTIDYGNTAGRLYHRRPSGTLRGYLMHHRVTGADLYQNVGMQDLTADVNFTDLDLHARPWCESLEPQTLAAFLYHHLGPRVPVELRDDRGAGGAFLTLVQRPAAGKSR